MHTIKQFNIMIFLSLTLVAPLCAQPFFASGNGTLDNPYKIATAEQLNHLRLYLGEKYVDTYFKLTADIDLTPYLSKTGDGYVYWKNEGWLPIGSDGAPFSAQFDGNNKTIRGLKINRSKAQNVGLFGYVGNKGSVSNINIKIDTDMFIKGKTNVGGLVGFNAGTIQFGTVAGTVIGTQSIGSVVGYNDGVLFKCHTIGSASGVTYAGGVTGWNYGSMVACYSSADVRGGQFVGGVTGANWGVVSTCYATGAISGVDHVGGLAGQNHANNFSNSYATGDVSGDDYIGALVGDNRGNISYCFGAGIVSGPSSENPAVTQNGPATQKSSEPVRGVANIGGLVGYNGNGIIEFSYWDIKRTGLTSSPGVKSTFGKTPVLMKKKATFVGWDFSKTWMIVEGKSMPYLRIVPQSPPPGM